MKKFLAVSFSVVLHFAFAVGFTATGTAATQIAADRAAHIMVG